MPVSRYNGKGPRWTRCGCHRDVHGPNDRWTETERRTIEKHETEKKTPCPGDGPPPPPGHRRTGNASGAVALPLRQQQPDIRGAGHGKGTLSFDGMRPETVHQLDRRGTDRRGAADEIGRESCREGR